MEDRRKHKRHSLRKGVHILHGDTRGELCNLSMGGFLCQCKIEQRISPDNSAVSICSGKERLFLDGIKFKRISEWQEESADNTTLNRRCGIEFDGLTDVQEEAVQSFISRYALN